MEKINKKDEILSLLSDNKRLSTTKISSVIRSNINYTKKYLEELEQEGKVKKYEETIAIYWETINSK